MGPAGPKADGCREPGGLRLLLPGAAVAPPGLSRTGPELVIAFGQGSGRCGVERFAEGCALPVRCRIATATTFTPMVSCKYTLDVYSKAQLASTYPFLSYLGHLNHRDRGARRPIPRRTRGPLACSELRLSAGQLHPGNRSLAVRPSWHCSPQACQCQTHGTWV
jgi:hypothetical protein